MGRIEFIPYMVVGRGVVRWVGGRGRIGIFKYLIKGKEFFFHNKLEAEHKGIEFSLK